MNPFAALLVSMHAATIYGRRLELGTDPPQMYAEVQNALQEQQGLQAALRLDLDRDSLYNQDIEPEQLTITYRWLRVCDLLSLAVLAGAPSPEGQIEKVPASKGSELTTITYRCQPSFSLEINPWPFAASDVQIPVLARYVKQKRFDDQNAYHTALSEAAWQSLTVTMQPLS
jgi:hypothetical protein